MVMSWVFTGIVAVSLFSAMLSGSGSNLAAGILQGAQSGITLALSLAGSLCLWSGIGKLMEHSGMTSLLSRLLRPLLSRLFPSTQTDCALANALSGNICANLLGMGNAATPLGIQAARRLVNPKTPNVATNELCRLIVLNTASIQLIPGNVAAIRAEFGAQQPFDILPAVWLTSLCSAAAGLLAAALLGRVIRSE